MKFQLIASCVVGLLIAAPALADTLLLERVERASTATMPSRGSTMDTVRSQFGEPEKAHAAVGQPPITRWEYAAFSVYFEHSHVINTVMRKSAPQEIGPRPVAQQQ